MKKMKYPFTAVLFMALLIFEIITFALTFEKVIPALATLDFEKTIALVLLALSGFILIPLVFLNSAIIITVNESRIRTALFGRLFVKEFSADDIREITTLYRTGYRISLRPEVTVTFIIQPPNQKETQLSFPFYTKDLQKLSSVIEKNIT